VPYTYNAMVGNRPSGSPLTTVEAAYENIWRHGVKCTQGVTAFICAFLNESPYSIAADQIVSKSLYMHFTAGLGIHLGISIHFHQSTTMLDLIQIEDQRRYREF
jgi:hypothetical protein